MISVGQGNQQAFGLLVRRYLPSALSYTRHIVSDDAEDVVQETFIKFWSHAPLWDEEKGKVKTWFYTILRNTAYSHLRKGKRNQITFLDEKIAVDEDIEKIFLDQEKRKKIQQAIIKLPKKLQQVIILRYYETYSNAQISEILEKTVKAVETLLVRARKELKRNLERIAA